MAPDDGAPGSPTIEELMDRMRDYMKLFSNHFGSYDHDDWTSSLATHLSVHSATLPPALPFPTATFEFTVQPVHTNRLGNLHGGCTSTLFDYCTSIALVLVHRPGHWQTFGVSRTLNCTYIRPVPVGTRVLIECEVASAGKKMAFLRGAMRRKADGALLATCEHNKVSTEPPQEKL